MRSPWALPLHPVARLTPTNAAATPITPPTLPASEDHLRRLRIRCPTSWIEFKNLGQNGNQG